MASGSMEDDYVEEVQKLFGPDEQRGRNAVASAATAAAVAPAAMQVEERIQVNAAGQDSTSGQSERYDLGINHFQCMAARAASSQVEATSISIDATFGKEMVMDPEPVGSLNPPGDSQVKKTFHGARAKKGNETVNQSVTMSIDPETLICLQCDKEHPFINSEGKPVVIIICDQNYVPVWPSNKCDTSVAVIRLANGTLHELADLLMEIFDRKNLPDGSVVLMGSVSHLHRVGVGSFSREWTQVVNRLGRRWPNIRVCPLAPLIRENVSGGVSREIVELASWLSKVYTGSINGLRDLWNLCVTRTIERSAGQTVLNSVEYYTITVPASLEPNSLAKPTTYYSTSSRPSILYGIDQGTVSELIDATKSVLNRDFNIPVGTGGFSPASAPDTGVYENLKRVVLVGASILKQLGPILAESGYDVTDLCTPGWKISPENISELGKKLESAKLGQNTAVVLDLFGNSCTRATLFDGSTTVPLKGAGGYHLPGKVSVCSEEIFTNLIEIAKPVIDAAAGTVRLIIPPQPRYLFDPCCNDRTHCTNMGDQAHAGTVLATNLKLRAVLKKKLGGAENIPLWIMDTCGAVKNPGDLTVSDKLAALKTVCARDGVHLTDAGSRIFAANITEVLQKLQSGMLGKPPNAMTGSAAVIFSGGGGRHFWRGFTSPVGSRSRGHPAAWQKAPKDRLFKNFGPYHSRRGWGGHRKF